MSIDARTELLLGSSSLDKLRGSRVLVVGLGGVGACATEMLCRAGIGHLTLVDGDSITESNINRQIHAFYSTLNKNKVNIMKERLLDINPSVSVHVVDRYMSDEKQFSILFSEKYDYAIDAIDTLTPKCIFLSLCVKHSIPVVSSLGSGGRTDPSKVSVVDISETHHCRLAYYVRKKLHSWGIWNGIKAVYSNEVPKKEALTTAEEVRGKRSTIGTISYMPNLFGCLASAEAIRGLLERT
jgi:tRNA threonylcarbamoyladenosine dehydratase